MTDIVNLVNELKKFKPFENMKDEMMKFSSKINVSLED